MTKDKDYGSNIAVSLRAFPLLLWSRRDVLFMLSWCTTIAIMVAGRGFPPLIPSTMAITSTLLVGASVYIYNDLVDAEMDSISTNHKTRPMASGRVPKSAAWLTIITSAVVGLLLALWVNLQTFIVSFAWFLLFTIYSYPRIRLKNMFIVKELVVSSAWILCSLIGSIAVTSGVSIPAIFAGLLFGTFIFLVQPALVDTFDAYEDGLYGVKTLSRALSWRRRVQMLGMAVLVMMTVAPVTYARLGFSVLFPITVVAFSLILLRWGIMPLTSGFELQAVLRSRKLMYVYFFVTQIILVVSSMKLLNGLI